MPVLRVSVLATKEEGEGMRSEHEIREKLEKIRNDRTGKWRENRAIYGLALAWVLGEGEE